jgi:glutamyl-tRNA reductase
MIGYRRIDHKTCCLDERERLSAALQIAPDVPHVVLATCNRMEVYWGDGAASDDVVRHLCRVAAGLESALVGERAVQGQLKKAYLDAQARYRLSPSLNRMFQTAIHAGKRVRTETRIAAGAVSHSQATVEMLRRANVDLCRKTVSIIGVCKLTEDILKYLVARQAERIFLSNRHVDKAEAMARQYGGTVMRLDARRTMLTYTDVLISATAAPHPVIRTIDMPHSRPMLIFDLAFPRDVEEKVGHQPGVCLYNLEDVERFARENILLRTREIAPAEAIIEEEVAKFCAWQSYARAMPLSQPELVTRESA